MPRQPPLEQQQCESDMTIEERMKSAVKHAQSHQNPNLAKISRDFRVPYNRLYGRLRLRKQSRPVRNEGQQLLSALQEKILVDWTKLWGAEGFAISRETLRIKAKHLCGHKPSLRWVYDFQKRHSDVLYRRPNKLDDKRAQAFNPNAVAAYFDELGDLIDKYKVKPCNMYNMDEKGIQLGGGRSRGRRKGYYDSADRARYQVGSDNLELVTVIECVSADGAALKPGFIFQGSTCELDWWDGPECEGLKIGLTANGWTDDSQCLKWFKETFIPQARARAEHDDEPVLLIFDGHGSHVSENLVALAEEFNILLFKLIPHATHMLQPLDVGVFGPVQLGWLERCAEVLEATKHPLHRADVVREYMAVRKKAMTVSVIKAAFRSTGIEPFNPNIFHPAQFAPSHSTSTVSHLPSSCPIQHNHSARSSSPGSTSPTVVEGPHGQDLPGPPNSSQASPPTPGPRRTETSPSPSPGRLIEDSPDTPRSRRKRARFTPTSINPRWTTSRRLDSVQTDLGRLQSMYTSEHEHRVTAEAHLALCIRENETLRHQLNASSKSTSRKQVRVTESFLNSGVALQQFEAQRKVREVKEADEQARKARRDIQTQETRERRAAWLREGAVVEFTGALSSKKKEELKDVAFMLALSPPDKATRQDILDDITRHFNSNPALKADKRFSGLFTRQRKAYPAIDAISRTPQPFVPS
ncbi:hypothetical protein BN946_scf184870.g3 [Trametes cinnabarina]|uniref:HTH CENPB-type domain-containing protein n=1 Tax=Pycnoporus cinnabarinus TaxID=5643 RepID=A0A060S7G1_PYCCI|nr:hypothetical protein BN946_scf184870.g3 [Trametes cinnabarina]